MDFGKVVDEFLNSQLSEWELARVNYEQLGRVKTRHIDFKGYELIVQYNPERIRSSAAKVDSKSIGERPCFLCRTNRPVEQHDLPFNETYSILVNPFPIFDRHLTITDNTHTDQLIKSRFRDMLEIAGKMVDYTIFYNGPQCGASAPDHFHFQAGNRGKLPLESDFERLANSEAGMNFNGSEIRNWKDHGKGIISLKGKSTDVLISIFENLYDILERLFPAKPEPMLNILTYLENGSYVIHIIPRKLHRPKQFFLQGENQLVISPASVDLAGLIITPRESDFLALDANLLDDIFRQVCFSDEDINRIINEINR